MKERIRLHEFDLMKGFAMLSVVLGHIYMPCFFQLYHIPLFFFVSGFFFKEKPVKDWIKGNCKQLIKPYIVVGVIISLVYLLFYGFPYFKLYAIDLLLGTSIKNDLRIYLGPIWFLLTLFWVRIIYNKLTRHLSPYIIITIILILTGITVLIGHHFNWLQVPYMIIQAIPAMFFFSLGHIYRTSGLYNSNKIKNSNKLLIISITTIIALTYFQIQGPIFNISTMTIPFFPMSFINAILWIYVIYRISIYIKNNYYSSLLYRFFILFGEKSMDILLIHSIAYAFIIPLFNNYLGQSESYVIKVLILSINIIINIAICILYTYSKTLVINNKLIKI